MAKAKTSTKRASTAKAAVKSAPVQAAPANAAASPLSSRSARAAMREAAARKRRNQNLMLIGAGVMVAALVVALVVLNIRRNQPVVGEQTFTSQGNVHIPLGSMSPIAYNSTPPTSGPHYENLAAWGRHAEPQRYEHLVHNLEDGGVVVYYQCEDGCPEVVAELERILEPYFVSGRHVVLAPNDPTWTMGGSQPLHQDMGARIALVAWRKLLKMDEVDEEKIRLFVERYEGIDHHRG